MLILYYRRDQVYPLQKAVIPNNASFSIQGGQYNQPTLSYPQQQLLSYSIQHSESKGESAWGDLPCVYPPLDDHNASNYLPYGDWVIRQAQQNFAPPIWNSYSVNAGFTLDSSYQPDNTQTETSQKPTQEDKEPATPQKVSKNKVSKRGKKPEIKYPAAETRAAWGSKTWEDGQHLFTYTQKGQWLRDRKFNKEQLREYVDNCPKGTVFRVQQAPTHCNERLDLEDRICRWANCPVANRTITSGWLRVCFDEFPGKTSSGDRDPLTCAGSMHLWCFEQVFDPVEFHLEDRLKAETRQFVLEERNAMSLEKLTDAEIIAGAYTEWFKDWIPFFDPHDKFPTPREYENTLSYKLNKYHLNNQTKARRRARRIRHELKMDKGGPQRTINVHEGNLQMYVALTNEAKRAKRAHETEKPNRVQERQKRPDVPDDDFDSSDTSSGTWMPLPTRKGKKVKNHEQIASNSPAETSLRTSTSPLSHKQRNFPRGSDPRGTSARRLKKKRRRHELASQPPVDRGHNLSMETYYSNATGNLNMSFTPSSSFGHFDLDYSTLHPDLRPPLKPRGPYNHTQGSLANNYYPILPQAMSESGFSIENPRQPDHVLGPASWPYQQQQLNSNIAASLYVGEHQPIFQDFNSNTPPEASQGQKLVEFCQNETKAWAQQVGEQAPYVLGDSDGASSNKSNPVRGLDPEESNMYQILIKDEDVPKSTQYPAEGSNEAMNIFAAQTQTNTAANRHLEPVACTESPQVAVVAEPWHGVGSFEDPVNYGGYSNSDIPPLFNDPDATAWGRPNDESRSD
jgi:hypothetical protein